MSIKDTEYRKGIFNLLWEVKRNFPELFVTLMTELDEKLERVPTNDYEQSIKFFEEMTRSIICQLSHAYDIEHEKVTSTNGSQDVFTLSCKQEHVEMLEMYQKYGKMPRFLDGFLRDINSDLYVTIRNLGPDRLSSTFVQLNNKYVYRTSKIPNEDVFLPRSGTEYIGTRYNSSYFTGLARSVLNEKNRIDNMLEHYEELMNQTVAFDNKIKESLKAETLRFAIKNFKSILSKIIIPVSLIGDEELRNLCVENGREVFVKRPTFEDLMPIGTSVHVYSSHDVEDDSSYIAKPIWMNDELPADTDELKYHGIGQYTMYDNESKRSLKGENPYVINNNVYVKADPEDFNAFIPEELLEDIKICEKLVESINKNQEPLEFRESEELTTIIESIQNNKETDIKKAIETFFESVEYFNKAKNMESEEETIETQEAKEELFRECSGLNIADDLLVFGNPNHPYGYLLTIDAAGKHGILRKTGIRNEIEFYTHMDINECCKVGGLAPGIHSVYRFAKINTSRQEALEKLHIYKPMEDGSNE